MKNKAKVESTDDHTYCADCKYFYKFSDAWATLISCEHPDNFEVIHKFDGPQRVPEWNPREQNANCDCSLWVKR